MCLTNRVHVAVRLFSNRSQMTSKCGKNKKVAHEAIAECVTEDSKLDSNGFSWNENLQRKQNWTAKSTTVKENAGKSTQFLSSERPCGPKSLDVSLDIAGVERIRSENMRLRSTLDAI